MAHVGSAPAVSVLMPVYNGERFLAEAIESILGQTFTDFEFVIIDDGSTDASPAILTDYASRDSRIRVLTQTNAGQVVAANRGLAECRAPLVARMDADDISLASRLERQVKFLSSYPAVAVVGSAYQLISETGARGSIIKGPTTVPAVMRTLKWENCVGAPTVMMRKSAAQEVGGYREQFRHAEDYDLWLRIADNHSVAVMKACLVEYRIHTQQVSWHSSEIQAIRALAARALAEQRRTTGRESNPLPADIGRAYLAMCGIPPGTVDETVVLQRVGRVAAYESVGMDEHARTLRLALFDQPALADRTDLRRSIRARLAWQDTLEALRHGRWGSGVLSLMQCAAVVARDIKMQRVAIRQLLGYLGMTKAP